MLEGLQAFLMSPWVYGVFHDLTAWQYVLIAFCLVQVSMFCVTLYLHRDAAHRAVDLHPAIRHFARFWIWLTSGMVTREWVAVHRKHHAFSDVAGDPHSPVQYGLKKILLEGAEVYRASAKDPEVTAKFGHGLPDDWVERNIYSHRNIGITLLVLSNLVLFGVVGIIILSVQLIAMPLMAAGVINGIGHAIGYRNFECDNAARNVVPWGLLVGGEELHNNHHAFPSSAKFSLRAGEFDIGWAMLRVLSAVGLAKVRRVAPRPATLAPRAHVDLDLVKALIATRLDVLRDYTLRVTIPTLKAEARARAAGISMKARKLLVRHPVMLDDAAKARLQEVLDVSARLRTVHEFRERLATLWSGRLGHNDKLVAHLREWMQQAEASGIESLRQFAERLRGYQVAGATA
jgi:stearoyl-CoA desaturase (Delta-9 desaturase)